MPDDTKTPRRRDAPAHDKAWEASCAAALEGGHQALMRWVQGMLALSQETSELAQARWQLASEALSALVACRTAEQVLEWHGRFAARNTEHCAAEVAKLSQLMLDFAQGERKT